MSIKDYGKLRKKDLKLFKAKPPKGVTAVVELKRKKGLKKFAKRLRKSAKKSRKASSKIVKALTSWW